MVLHYYFKQKLYYFILFEASNQYRWEEPLILPPQRASAPTSIKNSGEAQKMGNGNSLKTWRRGWKKLDKVNCRIYKSRNKWILGEAEGTKWGEGIEGNVSSLTPSKKRERKTKFPGRRLNNRFLLIWKLVQKQKTAKEKYIIFSGVKRLCFIIHITVRTTEFPIPEYTSRTPSRRQLRKTTDKIGKLPPFSKCHFYTSHSTDWHFRCIIYNYVSSRASRNIS